MIKSSTIDHISYYSFTPEDSRDEEADEEADDELSDKDEISDDLLIQFDPASPIAKDEYQFSASDIFESIRIDSTVQASVSEDPSQDDTCCSII
jgi:hypothetical protein